MPTNPIQTPRDLLCHPTTPAPAVRTIEVQVDRHDDGALSLCYCLRGDMARLRIPEPGAPERKDLLWEHTCFEMFVGVPGDTAYREFNFSPSSQWAAYAFSDYRQRDKDIALKTAPLIVTHRSAGRLELRVTLLPEALPAKAGTLEIGLTAVIEADSLVDGALSYWALHHPSTRPDFHHRAAFLLTSSLPHER